jgi:O-acetyl-ADP-ribose deacetylase (regulator of RNase III)
MIEPGTGSLLNCDAQALVNPVNTVGVMGKGLASQFRRQFPAMFDDYVRAVVRGEVVVGSVLIYMLSASARNPRYIISFPTKQEWMRPSRLSWIETGLLDLRERVQALAIESIAIPALGCGLGGLSWADVRPLIEAAFAPAPAVRVVLFDPR